MYPRAFSCVGTTTEQGANTTEQGIVLLHRKNGTLFFDRNLLVKWNVNVSFSIYLYDYITLYMCP